MENKSMNEWIEVDITKDIQYKLSGGNGHVVILDFIHVKDPFGFNFVKLYVEQ